MRKTYPLALLPVDGFHAWPAGTESTGGNAISGPAQSTDWSGGGYLVGSIEGVVLFEPDHFLTWRALMLHHAAGGEIVMPIPDWAQRPFAEGFGDPEGVPFSDGSSFDDGALWDSASLAFEVVASALEGDTFLRIKRITGAPLMGAHWFTIVHPDAGPRAYCIRELGDEDEDQVRDVWFLCPLRENVAAATPLDFEDPRFVVKLIGAPSDRWPKITAPFEATVALQFCESFDHLYGD